MIWEFIFLNLFLVSLGAVVYLVIRTLPRIDERPVRRGVMERWLTSELPTKLDAFFHALYLRTLRRVRVMVLKADNSINKKLESIKFEREGVGGTRVDLESMKEKSPEEIGEETGAE